MRRKLIFSLILCALSSACSPKVAVPAIDVEAAASAVLTVDVIAEKTIVVTETSLGTDEPQVLVSITPSPRPPLTPDSWMEMPVIPEVSDTAREIYRRGQSLGNRTDVFIKIGDSNSTTTWFLGPLGRGEYSLGAEYANLQPAIDAFQESFLRESASVRRGFTTASALSPLWADPERCETGEAPLDCEIRQMQPSFALVMLGSNDVSHQEQFESNMRLIIEELIAAGIVPVLSTKADNLERNDSINRTIAYLAYEYDIPLWNLWKALRPLDNHGAQADDEAHLTWAGCRFDDPLAMQSGWAWRNLTALQTIDRIWRALQS